MYLDFLILSLKNILHRKRRSWLTIVGILIGIAAVVALVSLGQGLEKSVTQEFERIGSDKIFINPGGNPTRSGQFSGTAAQLSEDDMRVVERTRGIAEAAGVVMSSVRIHFQGDSQYGMVIGAPTGDREYEIFKNSWTIEIAEGRTIRSTDRSNVMVGSRMAENFFQDSVSIRSKLTMLGQDFRVVGIMKPTGDPSVDTAVIMPIERARQLLGKENSFDWIFAKVQEGFTPAQAQENVKQNLRQHRNVDRGEEDFTVSTPQDLISSFQNILAIIQFVVIGIASISLLVGGVGIMNTMYTSVTERTREIGVMKAVGATRYHIMIIFLLESGIIGLIGGLIGVLLGLGLSFGAAQLAQGATALSIRIYLTPDLILGSLGFAFLVGTVSGVLPARNAAKLDPADALRYE
ncbi:MAG: ABC transporter permease [Candidatus Nanohaloarchaea archaeon]|nr:ABC transporter permease [Candidatus Nanohaloarchaea archaeon]